MWIPTFLLILFITQSGFFPSVVADPEDDLAQAPPLVQQFYQTIESAINHLVVSRDMHRAARRYKRQSDGVFGNLFGNGDVIGGLTNLAGLGSLSGLTNAPNVLGDGPAPTILQGIGTANSVVKQVAELDRMRCSHRLACEFMANRGLFNRSSILPQAALSIIPNNTRNAFNLSHPSTFRTVLGVLQLMRFHEFGAYPHLEAGLWGAAHRDYSRCRTQFEKCPSTSEAFITELNNTPGGVQGMLTQALQTLRPVFPGAGGDDGGLFGGLFGGGGTSPQTAANTAELGSSALSQFGGQQFDAASLSSLLGGQGGNLAALGANGLNQAGQFGAAGLGSHKFTPEQLAAAGINPSQFAGAGGGHQFTAAQLAGIGGNQQFAGGQFAGLGAGGHQFTAAQLAAAGIGGSHQQFNGAQLGGVGGGHQFTPAQLAAAGITNGGHQFTPAQLAAAGIGGSGQQFNPAQLGAAGFGGSGHQFTPAQLAAAGIGGSGQHQFSPAQLAAAGIGGSGHQFAGAQQAGLGGGHQFTPAQLAAAGIGGNQFAGQLGGQFAGLGSGGGHQFSAAQLAAAGIGGNQFSSAGQFGGGHQFAGQGFPQAGLSSNFLVRTDDQRPTKKKPFWNWSRRS